MDTFDNTGSITIHGVSPTNVHPESACTGRPCVLHNPTDHTMRDWPIRWATDTALFERACPHSEWVVDPDQLDYLRQTYVTLRRICCGFTTSGPRVKCLECGDVIRSHHRHDWKPCKCGITFVDGGADYTRIGGSGQILKEDGDETTTDN